MSEQRVPIQYSDLEVNESLVDADIIPIEQPSSGGTRRQKGLLFSGLRNWIAEKIASGDILMNPRSFTSGRFDSQELTSGTLSVLGWYTIAESADTGEAFSMGVISVVSSAARGASIRYGIRARAGARTRDNTTIEIINYASTVLGLTDDVTSFRIAKSDTVATAGFKIQMKIASVDAYNIQLSNQISYSSKNGLILVAPYLDNTPTLPDGVTVGTFLEAGEELSFSISSLSAFIPNWSANKVTNDVLTCQILWPEIPKQGTSLVITLPSVDVRIFDGVATSIVLSGATISNFEIVDKLVMFRINKVAAFTTLTQSLLSFRTNGTGGKLTIT